MQEIKNILITEADKKYQEFSAGLIPNINNILGVRLPKLRKIAKDIYKNKNWQQFINTNNTEFMEEVMLQGMVIGLACDNHENPLELVENFIPKIDNWGVCDSFCTGLKFTINSKEAVWQFLQPYFQSKEEYEIRFVYVMILTYFIDNDYIEKVLTKFDTFNDNRYYAKMAVAWALSICYIKFPERTLLYLNKSKLDKWTFNKSIQKICESLRVSKETKSELKSLIKP